MIITPQGQSFAQTDFECTNTQGYYCYTHNFNGVNKCLIKGANIPIYQLWENFYTSDFGAGGEPNGGYVAATVSGQTYYRCGFVLAHTEVIDGRVGAIVVYRNDTAQRTLAERRAEISNGQYTYATTIIVKFCWTTRINANYDYSKYYYDRTNFTYAWDNSTGGCTDGSFYNLMGVVGWQDGISTNLGYTLCFPYKLITNNQGQILTFYGLAGCFGVRRELLPLSNNFDTDLFVSEDPDDYTGIYNRACAECPVEYFNFETDFWSGQTPPPEFPFEDDYNDGGGGTGDYRDTSDTIPVDGTPTNSAIASGFINAYLLTQQNVNDFHSYLYSTDFLTNVKKLMNDPIDYILAFMLAPYTPDTSAATNIMIGGTNSEVAATRISSGYKTLDCGTITLNEFWGKFYDYNPYTKVQIYLPFIGVRPLDVDDVMAGDVNLKYRIDVLTGACVATISVNNARGTNGAVYTFNGNCHSHIPVSGKNYLETVSNVLTAGVGMAGSIASGNALGVATGAINVMRSAKEQLEHAGELTGAAGLLANYTPFLMVSRPSQSLAQNYNHYKGFIANVTRTLGGLSGYTEVAELVQTNIHCTETEFDEINALLKEGVYL